MIYVLHYMLCVFATCFCRYVSPGVLLLRAVHVPLASAEAVPAANPAAATSRDAATPPTAHLGGEGGTPVL